MPREGVCSYLCLRYLEKLQPKFKEQDVVWLLSIGSIVLIHSDLVNLPSMHELLQDEILRVLNGERVI